MDKVTLSEVIADCLGTSERKLMKILEWNRNLIFYQLRFPLNSARIWSDREQEWENSVPGWEFSRIVPFFPQPMLPRHKKQKFRFQKLIKNCRISNFITCWGTKRTPRFMGVVVLLLCTWLRFIAIRLAFPLMMFILRDSEKAIVVVVVRLTALAVFSRKYLKINRRETDGKISSHWIAFSRHFQ